MNSMNKNLLFSGLIALVVSTVSIGIFASINKDAKTIKIEHIDGTPSHSAVYTVEDGKVVPLDFTATAEKVIEGVVHIKSTQLYANNNIYQYSKSHRHLEIFLGMNLIIFLAHDLDTKHHVAISHQLE